MERGMITVIWKNICVKHDMKDDRGYAGESRRISSRSRCSGEGSKGVKGVEDI